MLFFFLPHLVVSDVVVVSLADGELCVEVCEKKARCVGLWPVPDSFPEGSPEGVCPGHGFLVPCVWSVRTCNIESEPRSFYNENELLGSPSGYLKVRPAQKLLSFPLSLSGQGFASSKSRFLCMRIIGDSSAYVFVS